MYPEKDRCGRRNRISRSWRSSQYDPTQEWQFTRVWLWSAWLAGDSASCKFEQPLRCLLKAWASRVCDPDESRLQPFGCPHKHGLCIHLWVWHFWVTGPFESGELHKLNQSAMFRIGFVCLCWRQSFMGNHTIRRNLIPVERANQEQ
jgi:hypothetical protein